MNLKELAEDLGLSQTTVSRALNGYPEVNEQTRRRVMQAADRYNYRPNTKAKSLATGRAMAIGHVIPVSSKHEMVNPIFGDFIAGAGESYSRRGYDMILSVVDDRDETTAYRELKAKGTVDGVIVHGPRLNDPRLDLLNELNLPFVVHGRSTEASQPYSWLDVNNRHAFERATEFLLDLGHRRIAFLNGLEEMDFAARRRHGYVTAMTKRGLDVDADLMRSDEMTETYGHQITLEMLRAPCPPTAFLVSSLITAIGVQRAVSDLGLEMGGDVSVVTHDDDLSYLRNGSDLPIFTATQSSVRDAGRLSADMLLDLIAQDSKTPQQRLLEAQLVVGRSTGPLIK
ncbi:UNVERIFIED_CONTAM: hypothetical protein GTU68_055503 [Idotea baltica]|nr:hypothetical protein [Idotea baltica]